MNVSKSGGHPKTTTVTPSAAVVSAVRDAVEDDRSATIRPEFFRLPKSGGDPYFGLTRSFYYQGEELNRWKLVRVRDRGKLRGVTLVPYDTVSNFLRAQMAESAA